MSVLKNILIALGLGLIGCANPGTDTGNPTSVGLKVVGTPGGPSKGLAGTIAVSGADLTDARIVLKEIDLDPLESCLVQEEATPEPETPIFDFPGPFVINLLDNTSIPNMDLIQIPEGSYCEIELNFDKIEAGNIPAGITPTDPIIGHALLLQGTREDGTPFMVRLTNDDKFKLQGTQASGFPILDNSGVTRFFIRFSLNQWFTGVDLGTAFVSPEGIIFIDEGNNSALLAAILENIKQSAQLFRDLNGDGILESNEELESLVVGEGVDEED